MQSFILKDRSNQQLLLGVKRLAGQEREATAHLLAHLAEIEARGLHRKEGVSCLSKYCIEVLHLSESAAYRRVDAARIASRFPVIFEQLALGAINLTTVLILAPSLTEENHKRLLAAARHKSKIDVQALAVSVRPKPDVPALVRKLPESAPKQLAPDSSANLFMGETASNVQEENLSDRVLEPESTVLLRQSPAHRPVLAPLSPERYKIQFTADEETYQALRQLQELLRHQIPDGNVSDIVKEALIKRLEEVKRNKFAQMKGPRAKTVSQGMEGTDNEEQPSQEVGSQRGALTPSRHIPAEVKRSVWERDKGQCAFVSKSGRRCSERGRLEFHHIEAYALGGKATIDNIALRCRSHNAYEGDLLFGRNGKKLPRSSASSGELATRGGEPPNNAGHGPAETTGQGVLTATNLREDAGGLRI